VFLASIAYLPILLLAMVLDRGSAATAPTAAAPPGIVDADLLP